MAFNLPGILGRNGRARQDMVDSTLQASQASARKTADSRILRESSSANDRDRKRTGMTPSYEQNHKDAAKRINNSGLEQNMIGINMGNAYEAAESKVADLKKKRTFSKGFNQEEYGEDRPTRGAVRSAKKDAKALGNAARDAY